MLYIQQMIGHELAKLDSNLKSQNHSSSDIKIISKGLIFTAL